MFKYKLSLSDIFMAEYDETWKKNKKFAVTSLRKYGFGTPRLEGKVLREYDIVTKHIKDLGSSSFNIQPIIMQAVSRVISYVLFDGEERETDEDIEYFSKLTAKALEPGNSNPVMLFLPVWLSKIVFKKSIDFMNSITKSLMSHVKVSIFN